MNTRAHVGGPRRALVVGVALGLLYGFSARLFVHYHLTESFAVITIAFLGLVPAAIGYLTVYPAEKPDVPYRIFMPWIPTAGVVLAVAAIGWEGAICIIMSAPMLLVLSSVGGLLAGMHNRRRTQHAAIVAILPLIVAPIEAAMARRERIESNVTRIIVDAPAAVVWQHVIEVPAIQQREQRAALYLKLGFPRPVSALLAGHGVGGVRQARFEGNVLFIEKITAWEDERRIAFTIDAQTDSIPPTTLDPHVTIGGEYFDVLTGEYRLEPLADGRTRVVLTSTHRVSTSLNIYTAWWARLVMNSIQNNILLVVRDRAQRATSAAHDLPS